MEMRRISSRLTSFYKKTFPVIWCVAVAITLMMVLVAMRAGKQGALIFLVLPLLMIVIGYLIYRNLVADMVDEVWLEGDAIIVKNRDELEKIPLCDVTDVDVSTMMNPRRITLTLRNDTRFGRRIVFMPAVESVSFTYSFKPDPIATELIGRIDALRTSAS
jgi:hypothetical protein